MVNKVLTYNIHIYVNVICEDFIESKENWNEIKVRSPKYKADIHWFWIQYTTPVKALSNVFMFYSTRNFLVQITRSIISSLRTSKFCLFTCITSTLVGGVWVVRRTPEGRGRSEGKVGGTLRAVPCIALLCQQSNAIKTSHFSSFIWCSASASCCVNPHVSINSLMCNIA